MAKTLFARVVASMSKNPDAHTDDDFDAVAQGLSVVPRTITGRDADDNPLYKPTGDGKKGKDKKGKDEDDDEEGGKKKKDDDDKEAKDAIAAKDAIIASKDAEIARLKAGKDDGDGLELGSIVLTDDEKIKDLFQVAGADAAYDVLKALKPSIAASGNKAAMDAFREQATIVRAAREASKPAHDKLVGDAAYAGLLKARKPEEVKRGQEQMRKQDGGEKEGADAANANITVVDSYQKQLDDRRTKALALPAGK